MLYHYLDKYIHLVLFIEGILKEVITRTFLDLVYDGKFCFACLKASVDIAYCTNKEVGESNKFYFV